MRRRSSTFSDWPFRLGLVAFAALGAALVYVVAERSNDDSDRLAGPPPGTTAVPVLARPLPAFTAIELEHLIDPATGGFAAIYLPTDSLFESTLTEPQALLGRVLANDKRAGLVFSENDFMPRGTRPGLVAGIPAGKRAVRLEASRVSGLVGLRRGDRLDLMVSGRSRNAAARPGQLLGRRSRAVVQNGMIVEPARARRSAADGKIIEEVVIAIDPSEVAGLTAALDDGLRIDTLPRSGQGGATQEEDAYGGRAHEEIAEIDLIRGTRRTVETTTGGPRPPAVASGPPL